MENTRQILNDRSQLQSYKDRSDRISGQKLNSVRVDELADELCQEYGDTGKKFKAWYCKVIYTLGVKEVKDLKGRCKDANHPGKLFSKLAKDRLDIIGK